MCLEALDLPRVQIMISLLAPLSWDLEERDIESPQRLCQNLKLQGEQEAPGRCT